MGKCKIKVIIKSEKTLRIELKIKGERKISVAKDSEIEGTLTIPKVVSWGTKVIQHVKDLSRKEKSICVILYLILEDLSQQL